jgi:hypothetical protein
MARLDRIAAEYRERALEHPRTRANELVVPAIELRGGVYIGLSVNK